jgi:hypothetical protein
MLYALEFHIVVVFQIVELKNFPSLELVCGTIQRSEGYNLPASELAVLCSDDVRMTVAHRRHCAEVCMTWERTLSRLS